MLVLIIKTRQKQTKLIVFLLSLSFIPVLTILIILPREQTVFYHKNTLLTFFLCILPHDHKHLKLPYNLTSLVKILLLTFPYFTLLFFGQITVKISQIRLLSSQKIKAINCYCHKVYSTIHHRF